VSSEPPGIPPSPPPPSGLPPAMPPPPGSPFPQPGYSGYGVAAPRTDGMAIAALVVGIVAAVGIFCYGIIAVILGPIAIYLGLRSRRQIRASGGALGGYGMAQAGWIIGLCAAILGALYLIFLIGVFAIVAITGAHISPTP
jgi:hypothetical protein